MRVQKDFSSTWQSRGWTLPAVLALVTVAATPVSAGPPLPGHIFTADSDCEATNLNMYPSKEDVYLDGGPAHPGAAGLSDGVYYVQITDPSGSTVLGTSLGSGNDTPVVVSGGEVAECYHLWDILVTGSEPKTTGYDDTTNPGGVRDSSEPGIEGWRVTLFGDLASNTTTDRDTDSNGEYAFFGLEEGEYGVCEVIPAAAPQWVNTNQAVVSGLSLPPDATVQFGNVCLGAHGGLTLGFWSNKNGQGLIRGVDLCTLTLLNLRNANGSNYDPVPLSACSNPSSPNLSNPQINSAKTSLRSWLLSASATNMAYMLSAQLTAMTLNVARGFVPGNGIVYAPGVPSAGTAGFVPGFTSVNALMADANSWLANPNGLTLAGSPARAVQEAVKTALDRANNNLNFVLSAEDCIHQVNYSAQESSCVPAP